MIEKLTLIAIALAIFSPGCAATRDFKDPAQRVTRHTAYTLQKGQIRTGFALMGQEQDNIGAELEFAVGFANWGHVGLNVAHAALGVPNINTEFNIVDRDNFGLGASLGFVWLKPTFIWILPKETRNDFGDISFMSIPLELETSYPMKDWLQFDLALGFMWAGVFGQVGIDTNVFGGGVGTRQIYVRPGVQFHIKSKVNLYIKSKWLLKGTYYNSAYAEFELQEGLIVSAQTKGWTTMNFMDGSNVALGIEWKFKKSFYMNIWLMYNGPFTRYATGGDNALAGLEAKWRF